MLKSIPCTDGQSDRNLAKLFGARRISLLPVSCRSYTNIHTYIHTYVRFLQRVSIACYAERCISHDKVVPVYAHAPFSPKFCLTVRPSVTRWYHAKTTPAKIMNEDRPILAATKM